MAREALVFALGVRRGGGVQLDSGADGGSKGGSVAPRE